MRSAGRGAFVAWGVLGALAVAVAHAAPAHPDAGGAGAPTAVLLGPDVVGAAEPATPPPAALGETAVAHAGLGEARWKYVVRLEAGSSAPGRWAFELGREGASLGRLEVVVPAGVAPSASMLLAWDAGPDLPAQSGWSLRYGPS